MRVNGVDLCVQPLGTDTDPPILLIMGSAASLDFWEDEFCDRLVAGGRFVIRYDNRDTGRSIAYEPGHPGYTSADLVADAVGVIEALGLPRAHVVGMSLAMMLNRMRSPFAERTTPESADTCSIVPVLARRFPAAGV